jgi:hypothetical protein
MMGGGAYGIFGHISGIAIHDLDSFKGQKITAPGTGSYFN